MLLQLVISSFVFKLLLGFRRSLFCIVAPVRVTFLVCVVTLFQRENVAFLGTVGITCCIVIIIIFQRMRPILE